MKIKVVCFWRHWIGILMWKLTCAFHVFRRGRKVHFMASNSDRWVYVGNSICLRCGSPDSILTSVHALPLFVCLSVSLSLSLSRSLSILTPFSRLTSVIQYKNVSILDFIGAKGDGGGGNNWSYKSCKAPVKLSSPTNQHPVVLQAECPSCHPTNSVRTLKGNLSV